MRADPSTGVICAVEHFAGDLVDAGELAEIGLAGFDANHEGALIVLRTERRHDRGGRREELRFESELVAGERERLLQPVRRVARRVQRAAEAEDERDAGIATAVRLRDPPRLPLEEIHQQELAQRHRVGEVRLAAADAATPASRTPPAGGRAPA